MSEVEFFVSEPREEGTEGEDPQHYWHVQDDNNKIVAQGEGYSSKAKAEEGFFNACSAMVDAVLNHVRELQDGVS